MTLMHVDANERVVVRTGSPGQALRVTLVQAQPETDLASAHPSRPDGYFRVQAELVVEAGYRLTVGAAGIHVERIADDE